MGSVACAHIHQVETLGEAVCIQVLQERQCSKTLQPMLLRPMAQVSEEEIGAALHKERSTRQKPWIETSKSQSSKICSSAALERQLCIAHMLCLMALVSDNQYWAQYKVFHLVLSFAGGI